MGSWALKQGILTKKWDMTNSGKSLVTCHFEQFFEHPDWLDSSPFDCWIIWTLDSNGWMGKTQRWRAQGGFHGMKRIRLLQDQVQVADLGQVRKEQGWPGSSWPGGQTSRWPWLPTWPAGVPPTLYPSTLVLLPILLRCDSYSLPVLLLLWCPFY